MQTTGPEPDSDKRGLEKARHEREWRVGALTVSRRGARWTNGYMAVDGEGTAPPSEL